MAADIRIQLASENPLTAQNLGYGILSLPSELVNQSIRWEGPQGMDLEVKRAKTNLSPRHCFHFGSVSASKESGK